MAFFIDKSQYGITRNRIAAACKGILVHIHVVDYQRTLYINSVVALLIGLFLVLVL